MWSPLRGAPRSSEPEADRHRQDRRGAGLADPPRARACHLSTEHCQDASSPSAGTSQHLPLLWTLCHTRGQHTTVPSPWGRPTQLHPCWSDAENCLFRQRQAAALTLSLLRAGPCPSVFKAAPPDSAAKFEDVPELLRSLSSPCSAQTGQCLHTSYLGRAQSAGQSRPPREQCLQIHLHTGSPCHVTTAAWEGRHRPRGSRPGGSKYQD